MALTKANLRTLVKQLLGNRTSTAINDAWYDTRVQNGYRRVCTFQGVVSAPGARQPQNRQLYFFELEDHSTRSISTGLSSNFVTPTIAATRSVYAVMNLYDTTNKLALDPMNEREFLSRAPLQAGRPRRWFPGGQGGVIGYFIDALPSSSSDVISVYETTYLYPASMATDNDAPVIPDEFHQAIAYLAASEGALLMDMPEKAREMESEFMTYVAAIRSPGELSGQRGRGGARRYTPIGTAWRY